MGSASEEAQMITIHTVCTPDYQWYLPTWAWSAKRLWPEINVYAVVQGNVAPEVKSLIEAIGGDVCGNKWDYNVPKLPATTSSLRFVGEEVPGDQVLITDADIVFLNGELWSYMERQMRPLGYSAFCGAATHPVRPSIAPYGWSGEMQRLAGGFVMVTPRWYTATRETRRRWRELVLEGNWGAYREADEVMLCRICKGHDSLIMPDKKIDARMRGLHLGDFCKDHRWMNEKKMQRLLPWESVTKISDMLDNCEFKNVLSVVVRHENSNVNLAWSRVIHHINGRRS